MGIKLDNDLYKKLLKNEEDDKILEEDDKILEEYIRLCIKYNLCPNCKNELSYEAKYDYPSDSHYTHIYCKQCGYTV